MSKAKTNALDALRALIAERQQYEQWISALEGKRGGTPEHVFERVQADYRSRLDRVVADIRGHAEELQLSISALSSRLVEVARDEDSRREGLQEAELRAAVGEYEPGQWEQLRTEAAQALEKIAADRASLDGQLGELRSIQKLSEVGSVGTPVSSSVDSAAPVPEAEPTPPAPPSDARPAPGPVAAAVPAPASPPPAVPASNGPAAPARAPQDQGRLPLDPVAAAASAAAGTTARPRSSKTPPGGVSAVRKTEAVKPDQSKTLKCPECGTPNYPTEWYCERCGGELATM